jgi:diguanylate cyclase (GGDEF)-like protein
LTARAVARPARRLAASARRISMGEFSIPALPREGPRELAETSRALNEMASTLTAVEHYAIALAEDPRSSALSHPLPGRTGQALQETLNHLRDSVHDGERRRLELQEAATHDVLTGLLNRAAAMDGVTRDLSRSERNGTDLMILFIDIDSFKAVNDTYGHHVGDDALRLTADALRMATRLSDVVARFGGDEFLVCGSVGDRAEVGAIAQRVHDAIASRSIPIDDDELTMSASIGMAIAETGDTAESLIRKADQALYLAKRSGRNQIAWYRPDLSHAPTGGR